MGYDPLATNLDGADVMVVLSVLYPASDGARFDRTYYDATHIPLVREASQATGLTDVRVLHGLSAGGGGAALYVAMAHLEFASPEALQASLGGARAGEVMADIANFTDIQPITQVSAPA